MEGDNTTEWDGTDEGWEIWLKNNAGRYIQRLNGAVTRLEARVSELEAQLGIAHPSLLIPSHADL